MLAGKTGKSAGTDKVVKTMIENIVNTLGADVGTKVFITLFLWSLLLLSVGKMPIAPASVEVLGTKLKEAVKIPAREKRHFGIELEVKIRTHNAESYMRQFVADTLSKATGWTFRGNTGCTSKHWGVKEDGSVYGSFESGPMSGKEATGMEIVSPPLPWKERHATVKKLFDAMSKVEDILLSGGFGVDTSCGFHVHHEIIERDNWRSIEDMMRHSRMDLREVSPAGIMGRWLVNILCLYSTHQKVIDTMVPKYRRSDTGFNYATPVNSWFERIAMFVKKGDWANAANTVVTGGSSYPAVRLSSLYKFGTVEFRQQGMLLRPDKILNWIEFTRGLLDLAEDGDNKNAFEEKDLVELTALMDTVSSSGKSFALARAIDNDAVLAAEYRAQVLEDLLFQTKYEEFA